MVERGEKRRGLSPVTAKIVVIGFLVVVGVFLIVADVGGVIPSLKLEELEAVEAPVGFAIILAAAIIAKVWKTKETVAPDGTEVREASVDGSNDELARSDSWRP